MADTTTIVAIDVPSAIAVLGGIGGLVWLIVRLSNSVLEARLMAILKRLDDMITREEVERLVELRITQHVQRCIDRKEEKKPSNRQD